MRVASRAALLAAAVGWLTFGGCVGNAVPIEGGSDGGGGDAAEDASGTGGGGLGCGTDRADLTAYDGNGVCLELVSAAATFDPPGDDDAFDQHVAFELRFENRRDAAVPIDLKSFNAFDASDQRVLVGFLTVTARPAGRAEVPFRSFAGTVAAGEVLDIRAEWTEHFASTLDGYDETADLRFTLTLMLDGDQYVLLGDGPGMPPR